MNSLWTSGIVAAALGISSVAARAVDNRTADLASMVAAERAFAAAAKTIGIKAAFLQYLDDDAVALQPALGRAKDVWRGRPDPEDPLKARLTWEPRTGDVSSSGDFGWLTGPYVFTPEAGDKPTYGCYFSLWARSQGQPWRVVLDQGIDTSEPCQFPRTGFHAFKTKKWSGAPVAPDEARAALLARDGELAHGEAQTAGAAVAAALEAGGRVYRPGRQIFVGAVASRVYLVTEQPPMTMVPIAAVVSRSQDLGYTYGKFEIGDESDAKIGYYLRVWSRQPSGAWSIVADILTRAQ